MCRVPVRGEGVVEVVAAEELPRLSAGPTGGAGGEAAGAPGARHPGGAPARLHAARLHLRQLVGRGAALAAWRGRELSVVYRLAQESQCREVLECSTRFFYHLFFSSSITKNVARLEFCWGKISYAIASPYFPFLC